MKKYILFLLAVILVSCLNSKNVYYSKKHVQTKSQNISISGRGRYSAEQLAAYVYKVNRKAKWESLKYLARVYIREAAVEGVNHDVAFAQMCHETNYLRYGNQVKSWQHNFCGLGAVDNGGNGAVFPSAVIGIRAHIQHLKAYANTRPLKQGLVDPRFKYVRRGMAPTVKHLTGTWASDRNYHNHLLRHIKAIGQAKALS